MEKRHRSLAVKNKSEPLVLDYTEIAADLIDLMRENRRVFDEALFQLLEPEANLIAFLLADAYEPAVVWNLMATDFSKGVLLGLITEELATHYAQLEAVAADEYGGDEVDDDALN